MNLDRISHAGSSSESAPGHNTPFSTGVSTSQIGYVATSAALLQVDMDRAEATHTCANKKDKKTNLGCGS